METVLVLTGVTTRDAAERYPYRASRVLDSVADLLETQGRTEMAVDCLQRALKADPDYADATYNLARLLHRDGRHLDAAVYWRRYLTLDDTSEWAALAKRALKFCEIQIAHS